MKRVVRHIVIPATVPASFFAIAATPVEVLGCRNRGLIALLVVLIGLVGAIGATVVGTRERARGKSDRGWWAWSTFLLLLPAVALIFLA